MTDETLPPFWNPDTDDTLVCVGVRRETHDVLTFILAADPPRRFAFRPGQFMTYALEIDGETVNRCYTISSAPTRPDRISLTVKAVPGGPVSHWLHAHLKPGVRLSALGPMGDFHWTPTAGPSQLFLSAGSGITPLLSMARAAVDLATDADIAFVHAARSPADLICREELALMARHAPGLKVTHICEADAPGEVWGGYRGRLDLARLELIAPDFREREIRCCGPDPYMAAVRDMLQAAGFDMAHYHEESFDFAELTGTDTAQVPDEDSAARLWKVEFTTSRRTIEVPADRFVLETAKAAGMRLPSSCTKGMCGTCKCRLVSGTVEMTPAGGIRQREIDQGLILICCSRPTSDLVIER
jgi:ferredoxin-NADP reductase